MSKPVYAAIEAGGTKFVLALGHADGELLAQTRIPTGTPTQTLSAACDWLRAAAERVGAPVALGIASFGPLQLDARAPDHGELLTTPKPGWSGVNLRTVLADALGLPVALDTDVNAAALAEGRLGAARGVDQLVYLTVGTGIGGGVLVRGEPLHGLLHPELGHLRPRRHPADADFTGVCPYHGDCFEGLASGPAMQARLGFPLAEAPVDHPVWAILADYLGQLCAQLTLALSPRCIVLGGGVAQAALLAPTRERLRHWLGGYPGIAALSGDLSDYPRAPLLPDSGLIGGLLLAERIHGGS